VDEVSVRNQWRTLGYSAGPDFEKAAEEYETFVTLLSQQIPEVAFLPANEETGLDSIYVRDSSVMTGKGVVLARMGKAERSGEVQAVREYYSRLDIPIIGAIVDEGRLEGGDVVLWDKKTVIVGQGYRTNAEGIRQLREIVANDIEACVVVPLPHWEGPKGVMHLMSLISPVDNDLAVVYSRLLPVPFRNWLLERSVELVEVPDAEFDSLGCNVLAIAPRKCLMVEGNPLTRHSLLDKGVEVWEYRGAEISLKGAGGPTCLTRPLRRSG
jgi:N-dimethylarginine dimethylaminohydrolase